MSDQQIPSSAAAAPQPDAQTASPTKRRWRVTRRRFLIGAGATGGVLALGIGLGLPVARLKIAESLEGGSGPPANNTVEPFAWFEITPENDVRLLVSKVEMGQGIHTSLAQIGAEELGVNLDELEVVQAGTHFGPDAGFGTGASNSISSVYTPLRQAAATLQHMLRLEAARRLVVTPDALTIRNKQFVVTGDPSRTLSFGAIVADVTEWEAPEEDVPLKAERDFQIIGQPIHRVDIPAKVTGTAIYGYDMRMDGMLYGAIARPPTIEATMQAAWPLTARAMDGVEAIVTDESSNFAGVVATSRATARAAVDAMQVDWRIGKRWQQAEIEALVQVGDQGGVIIQKEGDAPGVAAGAVSHQAEYRSPLAVQTALEPQAALADVRPDRVVIWASTQAQAAVQSAVADALGVDPAIVEVTPTYLGGGFGRKLAIEAATEAARLSQAAGKPVHVGWDRTESLRYGYFRPPTHSRLAATLDDQGRITSMEHKQASGDVAFPFFPPVLASIMGADFGAYRGATIRYAIPNRQTTAWRSKLPLRTGWWRGLGLLANTFAIESFMDELAFQVGEDALAFRLRHLGDDFFGRRMAAVLERAAEMANWGGTLPDGHARGLAICSDVDTVVAQVAEVSVVQETGQIRVHKVSAAMDCGLTINPDGAAAQVQGAIMWGVGSALIEEVRIEDGAVAITNFDGYPLLSMREAPAIEVALLEAGDGKPRGVGEPPIGPTAAAIANAVFNLTGARFRELPMKPETVLAQLTT